MSPFGGGGGGFVFVFGEDPAGVGACLSRAAAGCVRTQGRRGTAASGAEGKRGVRSEIGVVIGGLFDGGGGGGRERKY